MSQVPHLPRRCDADLAWAVLTDDGHIPDLAVEQAPAWLQERDAFVLDVRAPREYQAAHVPGAVSIPQADLATRLDEVRRDREVLVLCASGMRPARAARFLAQVGYERVANLAGGTQAWVRAGHPVHAGRRPTSTAVPSARCVAAAAHDGASVPPWRGRARIGALPAWTLPSPAADL